MWWEQQSIKHKKRWNSWRITDRNMMPNLSRHIQGWRKPSKYMTNKSSENTLTLQKTNMAIIVQTLDNHHVNAMVTGENTDRNPAGNCWLAHMMCEIIANVIDFSLYHSKEASCIHEQNLTLAPTFQRLVELNVLVAHRLPCGNGLEYGLANQFIETLLLQQPHFDVPKPALCLMYADLDENFSRESSKDDE